MPKVTRVRALESTASERHLIRIDDQHFVVSSIMNAPDHGGPETLVFASDSEGEITGWADLAGGPGITQEEAIAELERYGPRLLHERVSTEEFLRRGIDALGVVGNPSSWRL